jgi:hypothetical protein
VCCFIIHDHSDYIDPMAKAEFRWPRKNKKNAPPLLRPKILGVGRKIFGGTGCQLLQKGI